jgi:hypothetical protein
VVEEIDRVLGVLLERRIEVIPRRYGQDEAVANDSDQTILDDRGNAAPTAVGGDKAVQKHVPPLSVHRAPNHAVVVLQVLIEVLEEAIGNVQILVTRPP